MASKPSVAAFMNSCDSEFTSWLDLKAPSLASKQKIPIAANKIIYIILNVKLKISEIFHILNKYVYGTRSECSLPYIKKQELK